MQINTGFCQQLNHQHLQQLRDERDEVVALLQEVRVAVLAFHNRAGILLVNSASSFKASGVSPLLPPTSVQQPWTRRREKLRTRPRRPRTHRRAKRRRRRRRARPPRRRRAGAGGRGRGPGADDQPSGRRTFPSVLNARSPAMKPPRNSRLFVLPRHRFLETINRQARSRRPGRRRSSPTPRASRTYMGGASSRTARRRRSVEFPNFGTTASSRESVDAMDG